jgi:hypothetical protein
VKTLKALGNLGKRFRLRAADDHKWMFFYNGMRALQFGQLKHCQAKNNDNRTLFLTGLPHFHHTFGRRAQFQRIV